MIRGVERLRMVALMPLIWDAKNALLIQFKLIEMVAESFLIIKMSKIYVVIMLAHSLPLHKRTHEYTQTSPYMYPLITINH